MLVYLQYQESRYAYELDTSILVDEFRTLLVSFLHSQGQDGVNQPRLFYRGRPLQEMQTITKENNETKFTNR